MSLLRNEMQQPEIDISGLTYISAYIDLETQSQLLAHIDASPWLTDLKRRVQHYGYRYDYKTRGLNKDSYLGPLPAWLQPICQKLHDDSIFPQAPDQVIVNEYEPGQGISAHIDCVPCFDDTIASLSLGSTCVMDFANPKTGAKKSILLEEGSLIILTGEARYEWTHAIAGKKSDIVNGMKFYRGRRASLTFRNVILK